MLNSAVKLSGPGLLFAGRFLIIVLISVLVMGLKQAYLEGFFFLSFLVFVLSFLQPQVSCTNLGLGPIFSFGLMFMIPGLPWWLRGKESTRKCRRCRRPRFDPWVEKIFWRRKWQSTPVFLLGKSCGQRSRVGYSPCGCKVSNKT